MLEIGNAIQWVLELYCSAQEGSTVLYQGPLFSLSSPHRQRRREKKFYNVDARWDVWSYGVVSYI
jgi:hypothetical protein